MGKWTPDYVDDVLHAKIKNLASGAILRSSLEKTEPTISYENFVNDLDTGDSFTTSLIDILVKELAERRTRPTPNDRRLIADRSAKSLRMLAANLRVYRERSAVGRIHPNRRTVNLADYLTAPPNEMDMEEDEDEFDNMLDNNTPIEGVRISSDLYDAYGGHTWPGSRENPTPSPPAEEQSIPVPPDSPPLSGRSGPWSMPPAASTSLGSASLTRQPSVRRPPRSRAVDFNDFTSRRRSNIRESLGLREDSNEGSTGPWVHTSQSTRRFFPFSRIRRLQSAGSHPWSEATESLSSDATEGYVPFVPGEPSISSAGWFPPLSPPQTSSSSQDSPPTETSDERAQIAAPRLRRGGPRAPESMFSRHSSPIVIGPRGDLEPVPFQAADENGSTGPGEIVAYPTPDPTENEPLS